MTKEEQQGSQRTLDLRELVTTATWKEVLMELVESNGIDPWNIDIGKIANEYVHTIRKMQVMDLHIPANMTLAASILLRMKSDTVVMFKDGYQEVDEGISAPRQVPEVPELIPKFRLQPHKKMTLTDLMDALDEAIKSTDQRALDSVEAPIQMEDFFVEKEDIDEKIASAYKLISTNMSSQGAVEYSTLARLFSSDRSAVSDLFIPLLFLSHRKEIDIAQEQFFGDIMISLHQGDKRRRRRLIPVNESSDYKKIAEAALFASGRAMNPQELGRVMGVESMGYVKSVMESLVKEYAERDGALEIKTIGDSYVIEVRNQYSKQVSVLAGAPDITRPSLRILAYISKNEPVMQSSIVKAFGSSAYEHIGELNEKGFIKAAREGRTKKIETTPKFREYFEI